ncbi:putative disease resistance protein RGA1 [Neltuma alba]|uniref:putative disease resistance protein RGA1 n=1 Tax=Neltuma alba TaxID=207710 RepID=UPI0010A59649|nr:putative disease resistance protein RGA1 [Prosopis alba]
MEALAQNVIGLLGSLAAKELDLLCNFQDDLETMEEKVKEIKAVLHDAERKATTSETINVWLQKLRNMLLDAEDLLDAYSAEKLAREVMTKDKMAKEVRIFFSKSNRLVCAHKMGCKIRAIRKKLDEIYDEKNPLQLHKSSSSTPNESCEWRRTGPDVSEQDVVGRDEERMHLVSTLLSSDVKNDVSVIPIVGIGGLGKTTLAQQVYNDVAAKNHFEPMMWVCVSDESHQLSNNTLAQKIIKKETSDGALELLRHKIKDKRFLLVLDDVWNIKNRGEWLKLENLFKDGRKGSMIIVTTRSTEVADTIGTNPPLSLKDLDEDKSWELFCRVAFRDGKEPTDHKLVGIGKDIVRKCHGVPLAIRTIGSLLFNKATLKVSEWLSFRDRELANVDYENDNIFSILKLSYDHLPFYLKNCFAFCSLFPKDYEIERETLIQLWIAEGFIQPLDKSRRLEDVGDEYFKQLLSRCLFQDVKEKNSGNIWSCKMHDLIHDLAQSVSKNECYIVTSEKIEEEKFGDGIRHMSSHFHGACKFSLGNANTKKMRTILFLQGHLDFNLSQSSARVFNLICGPTTSLPKHLRVLVLVDQELKISESIGYLKHLRYLDLSRNRKLKKLPRGITKLYNLLTLKLNSC